jgi:hypothetical protein
MNGVLSLALFTCLAPAPKVDDTDNPFRYAKTGDWVEYRMILSAMKLNDVRMKFTVSEKSGTEVTVQLTTAFNIGGAPGANMGEQPVKEVKIDLTKSYDPALLQCFPLAPTTKIEKLGNAKEKITVGGKEYDCTLHTIKVDEKGDGKDVQDVKVWTSKSVPPPGIVKIDLKSKDVDAIVEFIGAGSK